MKMNNNTLTATVIERAIIANRLVIGATSHKTVASLTRSGITDLRWECPVRYGSKSKLYTAENTEANKAKVIQCEGAKLYKLSNSTDEA